MQTLCQHGSCRSILLLQHQQLQWDQIDLRAAVRLNLNTVYWLHELGFLFLQFPICLFASF